MPDIPQRLIEPNLLIAIHQLGGSAHKHEVIEKVADILKLSEEERGQVNKNGNKVLYYTTGWARHNLRMMGLLKHTSPRGIWELSVTGQKLIPKLLSNTQEQNEKLIGDTPRQPKKEFISDNAEAEKIKNEEEEEEIKPLTLLQQLDSYKFERLCAKIFKAMNFENVKYTQASNDKGVDGYGDLVFGLVKFRVVFQAKRYTEGNTVGAPDIQRLAGATMQKHGAERAVFITTSKFTSQAKQSAAILKIELIDGEKLIHILQEKRIGFRERIEYEIDKEFFEEI